MGELDSSGGILQDVGFSCTATCIDSSVSLFDPIISSSTHLLQRQGVLQRLNLLWILEAALLPHLVHNLHDQHALGEVFVPPFFPPFQHRLRRLVCLPEHALPLAFGLPMVSK